MKVGVVGTGFMGKTHLEALSRCGIVSPCICDANFENAKQLAEVYQGVAYADFEDMINKEKLDCVDICVPTPAHYPLVMRALEKNIPVLCEKPFAQTAEMAAEMVKKAKEKNCPLMVAHCLRFHKPYLFLKKAIEDKRFGELRYLNLYRHSTKPLWSVGSWLENYEISGGAVVDLHIHETDMVVFLLGVPSEVTTLGDYTQCSTLYHYKDKNLAVSAQSSWRSSCDFPFTSGFDAIFEKATVTLKGDEFTVITDEKTKMDMIETEKYPEYIQSNDFYENEIRYFISNVTKNDFKHCPPVESYCSTKTVLTELESMIQKKTISVECNLE